MNDNLKNALINFKKAWCEVLENYSGNEEFNQKYPFNKCFNELFFEVAEWVESETNNI